MNLIMSQTTSTCFIVLLFVGCARAQISYSKGWETVRTGRNKIIKCSVDASISLSSTVVHLYRDRPGDGIRRIMHFPAGATSGTNEKDVSSRFNGRIQGQTVSLTISTAQKEDAAVYYCAVWRGRDEKVFGSGTKLYVSDKSSKPPELSAYHASKPSNGKCTLLCQARGMFPDLVKFTWKDQSGKEVVLSDKDAQLEQKEEGPEVRVTSMLVIDEEKALSNTYTCFVQHDSTDQSVIIPKSSSDEEKEPEVDPNPGPVPTCPTLQTEQQDRAGEDGEQHEQEEDGSVELVRTLRLFSVTYLGLLSKNVLYFCVVCVVLYKKRAGNSETVSRKSTQPRK